MVTEKNELEDIVKVVEIKQELEKAIFETQLKYKYITLANDFRICEGCLNDL